MKTSKKTLRNSRSSEPAPPLPPFGDIPIELIGAIDAYKIPVGYISGDGRPPSLAWPDHYRRLVDRIAATMWPRWGGFTGAPVWSGAAADKMVSLTDLDLSLTLDLGQRHAQPVSQVDPQGGVLGSQETHAHFFELEDPGTAGGDYPVLEYLLPADRLSLEQAAQTLATALNLPLKEARLPIRIGHWSFAHPTAPTLPSKRELQRPRPHQVASLRGLAFKRHDAPGAVTSALPSGHAIQGLMGVTGALVELQLYAGFSPELLSRLAQYAVDVGDRRVYAGVHFPVDNLSSWCLALSLCPHVYGDQGAFAQRFMADAITRHSEVHRVLREANSTLLQPALGWLDELLMPPPPPSSLGSVRRRKKP